MTLDAPPMRSLDLRYLFAALLLLNGICKMTCTLAKKELRALQQCESLAYIVAHVEVCGRGGGDADGRLGNGLALLGLEHRVNLVDFRDCRENCVDLRERRVHLVQLPRRKLCESQRLLCTYTTGGIIYK